MCKGQCASGTCTWTPHVSTTAIVGFAIDVDGNSVIHAATTNTSFNPSYLHVTGAGAPASEVVNTTGSCWDNSSGVSAATTPAILADGSGKARVFCVSTGITLAQFLWNGTAWTAGSVWSGSGGSSDIFEVSTAPGRIAFTFFGVGLSDSYTMYYGNLPSGATWALKTINTGSPSIPSQVYNILGGPSGAAKLGYIASPLTQLQVVTETATGFSTPQSITIPGVSDRYALDGAGNVVSLKGLTYSTYSNGAWVSETVASGTPTAAKLVVDASGVPHVAWQDGSTIHLATRIGGSWVTETVSTGMSFATTAIDLAVGPTGKVAIAARTSTSGLAIFE
jgi:hypothetical protein